MAALRLFNIALIAMCSLGLVACNAFEALQTSSENDFAGTEILAGSAVQANGSEQLLVAIHLKNSNLTPVAGYVPQYEIAGGVGVQASSCSSSDANGVAICLLKATVAGNKRFRLTNAKVGLEKEIQFTAPTGIQRLAAAAVAGTRIGTTTGSTVQISMQAVDGVKRKTAGGYSMTLSIQGVHQ